jgi:hypothetical protein
VKPSILTAREHINLIPSDRNLSIDQNGQPHIPFHLPGASTRRELFALHRVNPERVQAEDTVLAELSKGLSGGDILNGCVNAIHAGSKVSDPPKWAVTQAMIEREIAKVKKAKAEHSGIEIGANAASASAHDKPLVVAKRRRNVIEGVGPACLIVADQIMSS